MINELTEAQKARFPEFIKKWIDIGLSCEPADRKEAEKGIVEMYKTAGLKKPKIVWCTSPLSQGITRQIVQKLEADGLLKKGEKIGDSVRNSVRNSVGASVGDSVWDSGYGQHDANWLAFYDFFNDVLGLKNETEKLSGLWQVSKNAGWYLPHENICWVSERHNFLSRDEQGRLHNEHGMALTYPDGWGIYSLHGVRFKEDLYKKIISREMPMEEILKITDIDQRTQAMKFAKNGIRDFYKAQGGKMIDEYDKIDPKFRKVHYELWKLPKGEIFTKTVHFALYECPSAIERGESREYTKGVPEFKDVASAMAWGMSDETSIVSAEEWKQMTPLLDES